MDDTLQELENELKRLTPRAPSGAMLGAIARELGPEKPASPVRRYTAATTLRSWKWASWSLAGAMALVAFAFVLQSFRERAVVPAKPDEAPESIATAPAGQTETAVETINQFEPVHATSVLYDLHEGIATTLPDRTEGREVRYRYVDTYTWKNPTTNASLRWSVPRDEVRLVRANLD